MPTQTQTTSSPLDNLLIRFSDQNSSLENLVLRISSLGHKLSDTNRPTAELNAKAKSEEPPLPFESGSLMILHSHLDTESRLIYQLREQVEKLEQLV